MHQVDTNLRVALIIPTKNEIEGMKWFMPQIKSGWYDELLVVDGGSTDGTVEYCREMGYKLITQKGKGLSMALADAFDQVSGDIILTVSPDGNTIPELIPQLLAKANEGYDMVVVSRYLGLARSEDDDVMTGFGNWMFTRIINCLFGANHTDTLVIFRAYRKDAILKMRFNHQARLNWYRRNFFPLESWEVGTCMRAAKLKLKVAEIPGSEPKRIGGVRKLSIIYHGSAVLLQIIYEFAIGRRY